MNIKKSAAELIGETPLLELTKMGKKYGAKCAVLAKLEFLNLSGSVKDRAARFILDDAEASGRLRPGGAIMEPTSGNTGIALAALAAARGYRLIVCMPESMSRERVAQTQAYGAEVVLTPAADGMKGAIAKAKELAHTTPGSIIAGQFVNPANVAAHAKTTGPEIWRDTDGNVDIFVAGVGTGGTLTGVGEYLKKMKPAVKIVALEPEKSPVLSGGKAGAHKIQGIGTGFIPEILNTRIIDEIMKVEDEDAYAMTRDLAREEGILTGISSGAAVWAALALARKEENAGKTLVVLLPDSGDRYLSLL